MISKIYTLILTIQNWLKKVMHMANIYITQHRRGTADEWDQVNIIPKEGEIVIELDEENSLHKLKIGDGIHTYADLAYLMAGDEIVTQVLPRVVTINLTSNWTKDVDDQYSQVIALEGITNYSRLDLQPSVDMLAEFRQLGLVFVTENKNGTITVYSVGNMPSKSYTMQATIVETKADAEQVIGIPVGVPTTSTADQTYSPTSANAQSGVAVKEAVDNKTLNVVDVISDRFNLSYNMTPGKYIVRANTEFYESTGDSSGMVSFDPVLKIDNADVYMDIIQSSSIIDTNNRIYEIYFFGAVGGGMLARYYKPMHYSCHYRYSDILNKWSCNKIEKIEDIAQSDWNQTDTTKADYIKNKPNISSANGVTTIDGILQITNLPTSDPQVAGQLWNDGGILKVSAGAVTE